MMDPDVVESELLDVAFDGYLKYKTFRMTLAGQEAPFTGGFLHGPGHCVSSIAALAFDPAMTPYCVLKTGDTRLSRFERGEPYVLDGIVAGRMDKAGASAAKIALAELAEEVGGEVVPETFLPLGPQASPTMPWESTEADVYYLAAVEITGTPYGDGGAMEVVDLIGPRLLSVGQAWLAMDGGQVAEGGRARTVFARALDQIGYVPALQVYVHDHPSLLARFDTLGLGAPIDLRQTVTGNALPAPVPKGETLESRINEVVCVSREEFPVDGHCRMVDARTLHAVRDSERLTTLGEPFLNQFLKLDYDRAKVALFYLDKEHGPMVQMLPQTRPVLAFSPADLSVHRRDVLDIVLVRDKDPQDQVLSRRSGELTLLGEKTSASSGQCDLYYHLGGLRVDPGPGAEGFVTLADAIGLCRDGHGDSHTEALLQRLADHLGWIPTLGMGLQEAREMVIPAGQA